MVNDNDKSNVTCVVIGLDNIHAQTNMAAMGIRSPAYHSALKAVADYQADDATDLQNNLLHQQIQNCLQALAYLQTELNFLAAEIQQ